MHIAQRTGAEMKFGNRDRGATAAARCPPPPPFYPTFATPACASCPLPPPQPPPILHPVTRTDVPGRYRAAARNCIRSVGQCSNFQLRLRDATQPRSA